MSDRHSTNTAAGSDLDAGIEPFRFGGEGEMVARVNAFDWAGSPIGPVHAWPPALRSAVSIALDSTFQLVVFAGPDLVYIYNDAAISIYGAKHPWALGRPTREVWNEIWPSIGPILQSVLDSGRAVRFDDLLLPLQRHGFEEEVYFTVSYSAIREADGQISGLFASVMETTERVINERRMRTLSELAATVAAGRDESAYKQIGATLGANPDDVPFAALYLCGDEATHARRVFASPGTGLPVEVALECANLHPVARAAASGATQVADCGNLVDGSDGWPGMPARCVALPLLQPGAARPAGVLLLGVNRRKPLDAGYAGFFELVAGHVATAVANARAARLEHERIEALAELDRSRSAFLANASHELRTPLTLVEGPLGSLLDDPSEPLSPAARESLEMARRNAARMKTLVNSLLDFASIESGRMVARLEPADLGAVTLELASLFRSGFAAAGLSFEVNAQAGAIRTMVDHEMWEKIVLNLLSNALKYTISGQVCLELCRRGGGIELVVRDTGIGIAAADLPHVTERFYRGRRRAARAVSDSSGLGLALVAELARMHGGTLSIASTEGQGTTVTVRLPHREAGPGAAVEPGQPAGWRTLTRAVFAGADRTQQAGAAAAAGTPAVPGRLNVVAIDDNEDIQRYLVRLLQGACNVAAASTAEAGLELIRASRPDVVLLDVMMPGMDGFELLRRIRADSSIQAVSVIVLSAHVGEDARLEAMAAGADDYLAKPFSGRELVAMVRSQFNLARIRRAALERERTLLSEIADIRGSLEHLIQGTSDPYLHLDRELRVRAFNGVALEISGMPRERLLGSRLDEIRPDAAPMITACRQAIAEQRVVGVEYYQPRVGRWFSVRCYPYQDGVAVLANDISVRKLEEANLRLAHDQLEERVRERTSDLNAANALLKALFDRAPAPIAMMDLEGRVVRANRAFARLVGYSDSEIGQLTMEQLTDPADLPRKRILLKRLLSGEFQTFELEMRYRRKGEETIWVENFVGTIPDDEGRPRYIVKIVQDITERKRAEQIIRASQSELRALYERLQRVRKDERIALAREVHDHLGQLLSAAKIDIKLLLEDVADATGAVPRHKLLPELRSASQSLDQAITSVRTIARDLRPPEIEHQGLYAAVRWHAHDFERRTRIQVRLDLPDDPRGPAGAAAFELFRVFQEALTNVLRHALATQVTIVLRERGTRLLLRVRDNGVGIARRGAPGETLGIVGMRERAALCGGRVLVAPLPSGGTLVSALFPAAGAQADAAG